MSEHENDRRPMEIAPEQSRRPGEWIGFAVLLIGVGAAIAALLLWLTGSFLIAVGVTIAMIAAMLLMGWLASGSLDENMRRR